ncbi:hypothetical protein O6H91_01G154700 [Diphasiastrum complanatum]|uniref:Uncharacterized protein n=1 Tax=Diphasiastrum complanatum TaxID=34168 RepID=A0ACC2EXG5_DIPCM|nr:hypothetical protein O6H91_01G154700 [Diphasiastrum complanatum]
MTSSRAEEPRIVADFVCIGFVPKEVQDTTFLLLDVAGAADRCLALKKWAATLVILPTTLSCTCPMSGTYLQAYLALSRWFSINKVQNQHPCVVMVKCGISTLHDKGLRLCGCSASLTLTTDRPTPEYDLLTKGLKPRKEFMNKIATTLTESWFSNHEVATLSAAEGAVTLGIAAINATREVFAETSCRDVSFIEVGTTSDHSCNIQAKTHSQLQKIRLSKIERVEKVLNCEQLGKIFEDLNCTLKGGMLERLVEGQIDASGNVIQLPEITSNISRPVLEDWNVQMGKAATKESVAVKSQRREQRVLKRVKAQQKSKKHLVQGYALKRVRAQQKLKKNVVHYTWNAPSERGNGSYMSSTSRFVEEIKNKQLLTAEEEIQLAEKIQVVMKMEKVKAALITQMGRSPTLEEWANAVGMEVHVFERKLWAGKRSMEKMTDANLRLVASIARRYRGKGLPYRDLVLEGSKGLMRVVELFDPTKGFKFSSYAYPWISWAISKAVVRRTTTFVLPGQFFPMCARISDAKTLLHEKYGRAPTDYEVAELLGISVFKLQSYMRWNAPITSLEKPVGKNESLSLSELISDGSSESSEAVTTRQSLKEDLDLVLRSLDPKERDILRLRFGLDEAQSKSLEAIGYKYNLTRERIRQIEKISMKKLKDESKRTHLQYYLASLRN